MMVGEKKKVVFCINSGRSGSHYLSGLFKCIENGVGEHEAAPICCGKPMMDYNEGNDREMEALTAKKVATIKQETNDGATTYLEANHLFVKGYGWFIPNHYKQEEIGVVILHRDAVQTAKSLLNARTVPGKTSWAREWYLSPGQKRNIAEPPETASDIDLGVWYVEEIHRRSKLYQETFPRITFVNAVVKDLNDLSFVTNMFENSFGLTVNKEKLAEVVGVRVSDMNHNFVAVPDRKTFMQYRAPESLSKEELAELRAKIYTYLTVTYNAEVTELTDVPEMGPGAKSVLPGITKVISGRTLELMEKFDVQLPGTELEWTTLLQTVQDLTQGKDPMCAFTKVVDGLVCFDVAAMNLSPQEMQQMMMTKPQ